MLHFLETDIREQNKYEKRIHTSVDNTVNDLRYEIKFENRGKDKNYFFMKRKTLLIFLEQKYVLFLEKCFLKISKNLITSTFFLKRQML